MAARLVRAGEEAAERQASNMLRCANRAHVYRAESGAGLSVSYATALTWTSAGQTRDGFSGGRTIVFISCKRSFARGFYRAGAKTQPVACLLNPLGRARLDGAASPSPR